MVEYPETKLLTVGSAFLDQASGRITASSAQPPDRGRDTSLSSILFQGATRTGAQILRPKNAHRLDYIVELSSKDKKPRTLFVRGFRLRACGRGTIDFQLFMDTEPTANLPSALLSEVYACVRCESEQFAGAFATPV